MDQFFENVDDKLFFLIFCGLRWWELPRLLHEDAAREGAGGAGRRRQGSIPWNFHQIR